MKYSFLSGAIKNERWKEFENTQKRTSSTSIFVGHFTLLDMDSNSVSRSTILVVEITMQLKQQLQHSGTCRKKNNTGTCLWVAPSTFCPLTSRMRSPRNMPAVSPAHAHWTRNLQESKAVELYVQFFIKNKKIIHYLLKTVEPITSRGGWKNERINKKKAYCRM